jgi:hypothetical protein
MEALTVVFIEDTGHFGGINTCRGSEAPHLLNSNAPSSDIRGPAIGTKGQETAKYTFSDAIQPSKKGA